MSEKFKTVSVEEANALVEEHHGWTQSIAKSVARSWNMDWQLDGLDGAAMEALIFCSRRFQPDRGVPFKGYARKRIHEASTEAARKSKGFRSSSRAQNQAREISIELFNVFPEMREGGLPGNSDDPRSAIRELLVGASFIASKTGIDASQPDEAFDFKEVLYMVAELDPIHQAIIWEIYWNGKSMRTVASDWETDELNVIREHKVLVEHMQKRMEKGAKVTPPRVRPGLKNIDQKENLVDGLGIFSKMLEQ
ncbi:MAG: hypothetical protein KDD56_03940 [Bdellovibrionales bacterium]|nr:hypothetical protein [Bdellovibrionales bacterium]